MVSRKDFIGAVRDRIATGVWPPGFKLPSSVRLAELFDVSESLVNHAMAILVETGEIRSVPGGARYVPGAPPDEHTGDVSF